jgi:hypothetical protein
LKCGLNQSDVRSKEILILYNAEKKRKNKWKVENLTKPSP